MNKMVDQKSLKKFDKLYDETYKDISRYVVCNCFNIDDVKDILQNIYMEVYKKIDIIEDKKYIIGIAKNKIYKYYRFNYKQKIIDFLKIIMLREFILKILKVNIINLTII